MSTRPKKMLVSEIVKALAGSHIPIRVTAYDGSSIGPKDSPYELHVENERCLRYIATSPNELGLARAYIQGDLTVKGVHPAYPYPAFDDLMKMLEQLHRPSLGDMKRIISSLGVNNLVRRPPIPAVEQPPAWERVLKGSLPHTRKADSNAIGSHYDRSNEFYRLVLGPSMTYSCACFPTADASLEDAQANKHRLILDKLGLDEGDRFLDIGCGWGAMVITAARRGIRSIGVTLSKRQAQWANDWISREGLSDLAEVRVMDYRDVPERNFHGISSVGMMEHVGVHHYPEYFKKMLSMLRPGGRLLNHQITKANSHGGHGGGPFIGRYIFPDGELAAPGVIIKNMGDVGFEVVHEENLRQHYAITLQHWCENLKDNWDEAVKDAGVETALLWGLYMAGSQYNFERNGIQIHQILAVRPSDDPRGHYYPLRPWWNA